MTKDPAATKVLDQASAKFKLLKFSKLQKLYYSLTRPKIKGLILFGVPGAGKGTYGSLIKKDWNLIKLSPGDLIRNIMKEKKIDKNEKYEK